MKDNILKHYVYLALFAALSASCGGSDEGDAGILDMPACDGLPVPTVMSLDGGTEAAASPAYESALTTKKVFSAGDEIGFFSEGGNVDAGLDQGFSNFKLINEGKSFVSEAFHMDAGRLGYFFAYYPWTEGIEKEEGVSVYEDEGRQKVRDFLTMNATGQNEDFYKGTAFKHTFAIVQVRRGEGFEDFNGDIYLQFKKKVDKVWIDMKGRTYVAAPYSSVKLIYSTAVEAKDRRLPTFPLETSGDKLWEAMIPCIPIEWWDAQNATSGGVTMEAVVLKEKETETVIPVDNYKTFAAQYNASTIVHGIRGSFIYTVVIKKIGLDIGVFPYTVSKWEEAEIKETIGGGISSVEEYRSFVSAYNTLFKSGETYTDDQIAEKVKGSDELKKYGTESEGKFTIFLTDNLNFSVSEYNQPGQNGAHIDNLVIPIDGRSHTISNLRMTGGLCGTLAASLKNLRFENIYVVRPGGNSEPIGLLADKLSGGTIEQCDVRNGWLQGNGKVGAAVGTMESGIIRDCSFSGTMVGTSDKEHSNLVGEYTGGTLEKNSNNMTVTIENRE